MQLSRIEEHISFWAESDQTADMHKRFDGSFDLIKNKLSSNPQNGFISKDRNKIKLMSNSFADPKKVKSVWLSTIP